MSAEPEPTLLAFVQYNQWANQELMALCATLDVGVVEAANPGAYGSILATFLHVVRAEAGFLRRILGVAPEPPFAWDGQPSLAQLAAFEAELSRHLQEMVRSVAPTQNVHEEGQGWSFDYEARLIFMSIAYHGIAHRTDITTFLSRAGVTVPELDVWGYQAAHPEQFGARIVRTGQGDAEA
ncbi:MAG TPA: DinB family protein [Anaerolineales bacterium]|nr:DinB family protein [Anaerolineales bacterium]HRF47220.1 DinB family protein [Anaerolineales bacterium]